MEETPRIGPTEAEGRFLVALSVAFVLLGGVIASHALFPPRLVLGVATPDPRSLVGGLLAPLIFGIGIRRRPIRTGFVLSCLVLVCVALEAPAVRYGDVLVPPPTVVRAPIPAGISALLAVLALGVGFVRRARSGAPAAREEDLALDLGTLVLATGAAAGAFGALDAWFCGTHMTGMPASRLGLEFLAPLAAAAGLLLLLPRSWSPGGARARRWGVGVTGNLLLVLLLVLGALVAGESFLRYGYFPAVWSDVAASAGASAWLLLGLVAVAAAVAVVETTAGIRRGVSGPLGGLVLGGALLVAGLELRHAAAALVRLGAATTLKDVQLQAFFLPIVLGTFAWAWTRLPGMLRREADAEIRSPPDRLALSVLVVGAFLFAAGTVVGWIVLLAGAEVTGWSVPAWVAFASRLGPAASVLALAAGVYALHHAVGLARALFLRRGRRAT